MLDYLVNLSANIVAAILIAVALAVWGIVLGWRRGLSFRYRITKRLMANGVSNFFASRADYVAHRTESTPAEYVLTANSELVYVGYWLAQATEIDKIADAIRKLVDHNRMVELVLLDPDVPKGVLDMWARFFGETREAFESRVRSAWERLTALRNGLEPTKRARLVLRKHRQFTGGSAFLFDRGTPSEKMLVDFKLFAMGREQSFGLEFRPVEEGNSLYARVKKSFEAILTTSEVVE